MALQTGSPGTRGDDREHQLGSDRPLQLRYHRIVRYSFEYWTKQASTPQRPVTFDFVGVSFNQVHDENQRQALNDIGTNFDLKDDEVDLLIKAAGEVLRGSPEFQAFLKRTNGRVK